MEKRRPFARDLLAHIICLALMMRMRNSGFVLWLRLAMA